MGARPAESHANSGTSDIDNRFCSVKGKWRHGNLEGIFTRQNTEMSGTRAALKFIRALPDLMRVTRHMGGFLRLRFLGASFQLYRRESRNEIWRRSRPRCGNPALRASCCDPRPAIYPENKLPGDLPDLARLLQPAGIGWDGHVQFFDCKVCGQEWLLDWQPSTHGGTQQLKKLANKTSDL